LHHSLPSQEHRCVANFHRSVIQLTIAYIDGGSEFPKADHPSTMSTPTFEEEQYSFPAFAADPPVIQQPHERRSSDEDGTLQGELHDEGDHDRLRVTTSYASGPDHLSKMGSNSPMSPQQQREQSRRLDDDLMMLHAERIVSDAENSAQDSMGKSRSMGRSRSRNNAEPLDDFDIATNPIHEQTKVYQPPARPSTRLAKTFKKIHESSFLVRYFFYIAPLTILLLIPMLFGLLLFKQTTVGGVRLFWFGIWLEIVWLTLWLARVSLQILS
jgi:hypothetical protein